MVVLQAAVLGHTVEGWVVLAIAAFAGGAFGAALGALPAFIFTGFMVIAGEAVNILQAALGETGVISPDSFTVGVTGSVGFGPVFGPHVAFAAGAAAAAYAAKRGYMDTGFDYFEAKNITHALGTRPDVLAVGGVFGVLGMFARQVSAGFGLPWDPIAFGVVVSAIAHRLAFGYPLVGSVRGRSIFDMSPFEHEEMRQTAEGGEAIADGGTATDGGATATATDRFAVEPWLPQQYKWSGVAMLGLTVGVLGAYIGLTTGSFFLGFGISAATLVFLNCGVENTPVTHHITLPASTAAIIVAGGTNAAAGSGVALPALAVGTAFGLLGALVGEVVQRVLYAHGDTHFDPPATSIFLTHFLVGVLALVGVFPSSGWVPLPT